MTPLERFRKYGFHAARNAASGGMVTVEEIERALAITQAVDEKSDEWPNLKNRLRKRADEILAALEEKAK
jgi:hypothetical protein